MSLSAPLNLIPPTFTPLSGSGTTGEWESKSTIWESALKTSINATNSTLMVAVATAAIPALLWTRAREREKKMREVALRCVRFARG